MEDKDIKTAADLKAKYPALYNTVLEMGKEQGRKEHREVIEAANSVIARSRRAGVLR